MNNRRFFFKNSLSGIRRLRGRYLPLGIIVALTIAVETAALALTAACTALADEKYGLIKDMPPEKIEAEMKLYRQISEANAVKQVGMYINAGALIIGVISVIFISLLMQRSRIYEVGVYYSIGFRRKFIIRTLLFETFVFTAAASLTGVILGSAALPLLIKSGAIIDVSEYLYVSKTTPLLTLGAALLPVFIPTLTFSRRLSKTDPNRLLSG